MVEFPFAEPNRVKWDRHDHINVQFGRQGIPKQAAERISQGVFSFILQQADGFPQGRHIGIQRPRSCESRFSSPAIPAQMSRAVDGSQRRYKRTRAPRTGRSFQRANVLPACSAKEWDRVIRQPAFTRPAWSRKEQSRRVPGGILQPPSRAAAERGSRHHIAGDVIVNKPSAVKVVVPEGAVI